jgi:hypothetical protein
MKTKYSLMIIGLMLCAAACKKDINGSLSQVINKNDKNSSSELGQLSIIEKWNIVTDSTFAGAGITNHAVDYSGQPGDYFDIRANGYIYTKEGAVLDTLSYTLLSDTTIIIKPFGLAVNSVPPISGHITNLTLNSVNIASPEFATPGGLFGRRLSLSR